VLRQLKPGRAVLLYGHLPPARLHLRAWFSDRRLRRLAIAPAGALADAPRYAPANPLEAWPEPASVADEEVA
jgi:hypothetical protein